MVLLFRFKVLRTTTGPSPLPLHKGGEYNVLLMWGQVGCNHPLPLWASEVFRRSTKCASVPREGSTPQCDARTSWGGVRFSP